MTNKTSDNSSLTKVNTAIVIAVLAMHIGIAAALTHMHMPKKVVKKPEEVKPVEIQLISLQEVAKPMPIEVEQPTSEQSMPTAENQETSADQPQNQPKPEKTEPQAKSKTQVESELVEETQVVNESEPELQQETEPETDLETITKIETPPIIDNNEHQRLIEQAAREQAAREQAAREQAAREQAAREQAAREQAALEQAAREQVALEQAAREQVALEQAALEQAAREQAAREQAAREQAAANNTPKSFSESQARWKRKPDFKLPMKEDRRVSLGETFSVTLELIVDKQGNVTKATVIQSSDNRVVDDATVKAVKKSKLHPFTENNLPVVGKITLPVNYGKK